MRSARFLAGLREATVGFRGMTQLQSRPASPIRRSLGLVRQVERLASLFPVATLASWMIKLGALIVPLMNLLHETQVSYDVMQMDETTVQVLKEDGRAAQTKSRMWVRRGGSPTTPVILFDYEPTRSGAVAWRLLEDFKGILQSDGRLSCACAPQIRRSTESAEGDGSRQSGGRGPRADPAHLSHREGRTRSKTHAREPQETAQ